MRLRLSRIRLNICGLENGSGRTRKQTKDRQAVIWKKKKCCREILEFSSKSESVHGELEKPLSIKATLLSETKKKLKIPISRLSSTLSNICENLQGSALPSFSSVSHVISLYFTEIQSSTAVVDLFMM